MSSSDLTEPERRFLARIAKKYPPDQDQPLATPRGWVIVILTAIVVVAIAGWVPPWYLGQPLALALLLIQAVQQKRFNRFKTKILAKVGTNMAG